LWSAVKWLLWICNVSKAYPRLFPSDFIYSSKDVCVKLVTHSMRHSILVCKYACTSIVGRL
jgi:hypothetical protein